MEKEDGSYHLGCGIIGIWGLYSDNGKETGSYYNGVISGLGFRAKRNLLALGESWSIGTEHDFQEYPRLWWHRKFSASS